MSARKKKNVPFAKEPKPEDVEEPQAIQEDYLHREHPKAEPQTPVSEAPIQKQEVPPTAAAEKPIVVSQPLKNILTRINSLKPNELAIIEQVGLPIKDLADWMFMMEQTLRQVPSVTEKGIAEELKKSLMAEAQKQPAASTGNVGGGGALGGIMQALPQLLPLLTGGGSSVLQDKIMDMAIESMGLGNALVKTMIIKMAPEISTTLLKPFEKKEGT